MGMQRSIRILFSLLLFLTAGYCSYAESALPISAPNAKPCTYWWWLGSAVDEANITWNLEEFARADFGGVHIIPIYGIKGEEERHIDFLSPKWISMLAHTLREAQRLGLSVDMSTGTGWPFGGPMVETHNSAQRLELKSFLIKSGGTLKSRLKPAIVATLMAFGEKQPPINLLPLLAENGKLDWTAPEGEWRIIAGLYRPTGQQVKRAAPGAKGPVLNPFSPAAMTAYQESFDTALAALTETLAPRAQYHDSFEYYKANWAPEAFERFEKECGYDLREHLPALLGEGEEEYCRRVGADYQRTIASLHRDFIAQWSDWAHAHGQITRDQAHGAPGNLLDIYAAADIPETEIFGASAFPIPGLRLDPKFKNARPNPLVLKVSSSAAHVTGKPLVSSETCTWLGEHFQVALSQAKPEIDQLFTCGINHIFYHGVPYSPKEAPWPGWQFYASTHFGPANPFFRDIGALNRYIECCQERLREGEPANDVLLYFPIEDIWHEKEKDDLIHLLTVHDESWPHVAQLSTTAKMLLDQGYGFDYISDRQLLNTEMRGRSLQTPGGAYRTLVIPPARFMPIKTARQLIDFLGEGGTVIFQDALPQDVPGFANLETRSLALKALFAKLRFKENPHGDQEAEFFGGHAFITKDLANCLDYLAIPRCTLTEKGIRFIKRRNPETRKESWFLSNLGAAALNESCILESHRRNPLVNPSIFYPMQEAGGALEMDAQGAIPIRLAPGESCFIESGGPASQPLYRFPTFEGDPLVLNGPWELTFLEGGPSLPQKTQLPKTAPWSSLEDEATQSFSGTARYSTTFHVASGHEKAWLLDLGKVCESARIFLNGNEQGVLFAHPFSLSLKGLQAGENRLEIEVTNLGANRIRHLDQQQVNWKKFYDINFVDIQYKKFDASQWPVMDSGLLGPITLHKLAP